MNKRELKASLAELGDFCDDGQWLLALEVVVIVSDEIEARAKKLAKKSGIELEDDAQPDDGEE